MTVVCDLCGKPATGIDAGSISLSLYDAGGSDVSGTGVGLDLCSDHLKVARAAPWSDIVKARILMGAKQ